MGLSKFNQEQRANILSAAKYEERRDLNQQQQANILSAATEGERRNPTQKYRRRKGKGKGSSKKGRGTLYPVSLAISQPSKSEPSGVYGPGTGRGALPSKKKLLEVKRSPSLLEQLRRDGGRD